MLRKQSGALCGRGRSLEHLDAVQIYIETEGFLNKISRNTRESSSLLQCRSDVSLVRRKGSELE